MSEVKYEWRKKESSYKVGLKPEHIILPEASYIEIAGVGNPNLPDFSERVGVLFTISYAIKMMPKDGIIPEGYFDYTVYPLQGIWDQIDTPTVNSNPSQQLVKENLSYIVSVQQPSFVTKELFEVGLTKAMKKKPHPYLSEVRFVTRPATEYVQVLHEGPYDDEPATFELMKQYMKENGFTKVGRTHHEVYIKPKKDGMTEEEMKSMRTILRYEVRR